MTELFVQILAAGMAGSAFGAVYFASVWRSLRPERLGDATPGSIVGGALLRLGLAAAFLAAVVSLKPSAVGVAAASAGFFLARAGAVALARRPCGRDDKGGHAHGD